MLFRHHIETRVAWSAHPLYAKQTNGNKQNKTHEAVAEKSQELKLGCKILPSHAQTHNRTTTLSIDGTINLRRKLTWHLHFFCFFVFFVFFLHVYPKYSSYKNISFCLQATLWPASLLTRARVHTHTHNTIHTHTTHHTIASLPSPHTLTCSIWRLFVGKWAHEFGVWARQFHTRRLLVAWRVWVRVSQRVRARAKVRVRDLG